MLDGKRYSDKSSHLITSNSGSIYQFDCYEVTLSLFDELAQTRNVLADRLFVQENIKENYDVVVVGSGMGGGVLANRLADIGLKVAVLEAGSMLFPTHVGNLPRMIKLGLFSKHIWSLWSRYALKNYQSAKNSQYDGGQGYNLGGRSLFWGAFIPEMREYEFRAWPPDVKEYLLNEGYASANKLVKKSTYTDCEYQVAAKEFLASRLKNINLIDAPLAIDYAKSACQPTLPTIAKIIFQWNLGTFPDIYIFMFIDTCYLPCILVFLASTLFSISFAYYTSFNHPLSLTYSTDHPPIKSKAATSSDSETSM